MEMSGPPRAVVTSGSFRRTLHPGESLSFGRAAEHQLRIGYDPVDLRVSRSAGNLECRSDGVLIHNTSSKRTIHVETFPGPPFEVLPLMLVGTAPHELVTLVIHGEAEKRYPISVDMTLLRPSTTGTAGLRSGGEGITVGYARIESLSDRQRSILFALCLPGRFGWDGRATTPTYSDMARILTDRGTRATPKSVRNALDDLRCELAERHGVQGIHETAPQMSAGQHSYLPALAQWARLSENVRDDELETFDARDTSSNP